MAPHRIQRIGQCRQQLASDFRFLVPLSEVQLPYQHELPRDVLFGFADVAVRHGEVVFGLAGSSPRRSIPVICSPKLQLLPQLLAAARSSRRPVQLQPQRRRRR